MKKVKDIAIFGAGGFGREVACLLRKINAVEPTWNFVGFYDDGLEIRFARVLWQNTWRHRRLECRGPPPQRGGGVGQSQNAPNCGEKNH